MKKSTNESITKNSANLDEIVNNIDEIDAILNSREFITTLVNDLITNKRNVVEWKLVDGIGEIDDVDSNALRDEFGVDYSFDFKYKYQDKVFPLTIFISGTVPYNITKGSSGDYFNAPEPTETNIDYKNLGNNLDLGLFDQDGSEINIKWLTPQLVKNVTSQILQQYI